MVRDRWDVQAVCRAAVPGGGEVPVLPSFSQKAAAGLLYSCPSTTPRFRIPVAVMSTASFRVLQEFGDQWSAVAVQNLLSAAGIESHLLGTDPAAALSMGGAPTNSLVRLRVSEEDYPRARSLLLEHDEEMAGRRSWLCDRCDEPNGPTFDFCWNCDAGRSQRPVPAPAATLETDSGDPIDLRSPFSLPPEDSTRTFASANPYRPVGRCERAVSPERVLDSEESVVNYETAVRRAWLASITSLLVFPPLICLLAVYLLCRLPPRPRSAPPSYLKIGSACAFTVLGFINGVVMWLIVWR